MSTFFMFTATSKYGHDHAETVTDVAVVIVVAESEHAGIGRNAVIASIMEE